MRPTSSGRTAIQHGHDPPARTGEAARRASRTPAAPVLPGWADVPARLGSTVPASPRGVVSPRLRVAVPADVARRILAHGQRISIADRRGVRRDPAAGASSSHRDPLPSCALVMVRVADCRATSRAENLP
jgi:hypothetical protein